MGELLKDRVSFEYGYAVRIAQENLGVYPVYGSNGITGYIDNYKIQGSGIIIGRKGSVGKVHYSQGNFTSTDTSYYLNIKDTNRDFLKFWFYYLPLIGLEKLNTHSAVPGLSRELAYLIKISPPSFEDQQKIASVLSALDAKIELNNKINKELEAMAKTLYDYWFVQFDFPNEDGKPYKSSGGAMVYSPKLKRDIPEGWEVNVIQSLIKEQKTGDWGKENRENNHGLKVSCIRGADINGLKGQGELKPPIRFITEKNQFKIIKPFEFIVEISGGSPTQSTGRLAYVTEETLSCFSNPIICSNFCKVFSLKEEELFFYFVFLWNDIYNNNILFGYEGKTSGIKNLLFDSFIAKHFIFIPPKKLIIDFDNLLKIQHQLIQKNLKQNQQLASLRDFLLPMLMNGQVAVV